MRRTVGSVMSITLAGKCLNLGSHKEISIGKSREKKENTKELGQACEIRHRIGLKISIELRIRQ